MILPIISITYLQKIDFSIEYFLLLLWSFTSPLYTAPSLFFNYHRWREVLNLQFAEHSHKSIQLSPKGLGMGIKN